MKSFNIQIEPRIFERYPETRVAYLVASGIKQLNQTELPESFISASIKQFTELSLNRENLVTHETIARWRDIYRDCGVKPKTYKSSIESLAIRFIKHAYSKIMPPVDIYNYVSLSNMLPMGGYDLNCVEGSVELRYARNSDLFEGMHKNEGIELSKEHIVYADSKDVICWMWNHKDARRTMITSDTNNIMFIVDSSMTSEYDRQDNAILQLKELLISLQCTVISMGTMDIHTPNTNIEF